MMTNGNRYAIKNNLVQSMKLNLKKQTTNITATPFKHLLKSNKNVIPNVCIAKHLLLKEEYQIGPLLLADLWIHE